MTEINPTWVAYIDWMLASDSDKGAITTIEEWARSNKISPRTIRRWKTIPEFQEYMDRRVGSASVSTDVGGAKGAVSEKEGTGDELDYLTVKAKLLESAKNGNAKAQELYFRTYGKTFVEEEQAARSTDLSALDLPELVAKSILAIGTDLVIEHLTKSGYTVTKETEGA